MPGNALRAGGAAGALSKYRYLRRMEFITARVPAERRSIPWRKSGSVALSSARTAGQTGREGSFAAVAR